MAKANLVLPDGTKVTIEGTATEVATLLDRFSQMDSGTRRSTPRARSGQARKKSGSAKKLRRGPTGHILHLRDEGFFKSRRALPDIQRKLEEQGHIYAQTSLSPVMLRLVKTRELRRLKEKKGWVYVK